MDDPDEDREITRIRGRLTSLEAERAELIARLAVLEDGRLDAMSRPPPQGDAAANAAFEQRIRSAADRPITGNVTNCVFDLSLNY